MASRFPRYAKRIQNTVAGTPGVIPKPTTFPRTEKATATGLPKSPTPSKSQFYGQSKTSEPLPELPRFFEPPYNPVLLPATLPFSFEQGKRHLIQADARFEKLFANLKCRPFEQLAPVDPFQTLVTSILVHHISGLGAKTIRHRFLRFFDRSLPEKVPLEHEGQIKYTFPSPGRVASVNEQTFRAAGLSERTAGYVLDLANRFADGRLSTDKLINASDEEVLEMLTAVRGIGKWTAIKFAILSLRRPDILPVDDLGIQKGLLKWVISSHEPNQYSLRFDLNNIPRTNKGEPGKPEEAEAAELREVTLVFPASGEASTSTVKAPSLKPGNRVLPAPTNPVQLPEGITLEILKTRANGQKVKGGCYLLPSEMEALTASWRPYRSIGVFYLWALVDESKPRRKNSVSADDQTQPSH